MKRQAIALLSLLFCYPDANAQEARDPTQPPGVPVRSSTPFNTPANARVLNTLRVVNGPLVLIERHGRLHVVFEGRLYAEGQRFGSIEIVRIRESEVRFRDSGALYTMSRFPNVQRQPAVLPSDRP